MSGMNSPTKRRGWLASFGANILPVLSLVLALISPTPFIRNGYGSSQNPKSVLLSGSQALYDKQPQHCQQMHQCALHFNGESQWIELHDFRGFDTPAFTLETQFNWTGSGTPIPPDTASLASGIPFISINGGQGPSSNTDINLFFGIQASTGRLMVVFEAAPASPGLTGQDYSLVGSTSVTADAWHHAAATYDGQTLSLFLDGNLDAERTFDAPILPQLVDARDVYLAAALRSDGRGLGFFKGDMDEARIWEVARSQSEVRATANLDSIEDPNLLVHWSMNEGSGNRVNDSSGRGFHGKAQNSSTWTDGGAVVFSATPLVESATSSHAVPNAPTLISPANGATGVSTSPTLNVAVGDPDAGDLTVTFYGRVAPQTRRPDFTVVALPDTQLYAKNNTGFFEAQTQWIVDQQSAQNIVFVGHLGDMVDDWNFPREWVIASAAMGKLEPSGIPYGIGIGNCDEDHYGVPPETTFFNTYFPASRFDGRSYYGGAYNGDNGNSYQLFSGGGADFIVIDLKFNLSTVPNEAQAVLAWAHGLLQTYGTRRAIVITHNLLTTSNIFSADGAEIYNALKDRPNLFLMLGGHLDNEGQRQDPGSDGHTIYSLRSDYQTRANGGNGWLRLLRFSPETNKIYVSTYSPYLGQYETDADSQFSLDYNMDGSSFQVIGSSSVSSGSNATADWPNLLAGGKYDWYASVSDGTSTTDGPIWSFTTTSGTTLPTVTTQPADQTVTAGQSASFTAAASGSPTPTVKWQVSTDGGATFNDISGAVSTTYTFTAQSTDTGRQYHAVFTNTAGSATSSAAVLSVNTVPVVTLQPSNQTINAGQSVSFSAAASGSPVPTAQWQVSGDGGSTWSNIAGAAATTYTFTAQGTDNGRQYRAVFTNTAGSATSNAAVLTVHSAPEVTVQPANQTVTAGQSASFIAAASGFPTPTVKWQVSTDNGDSWNNIPGASSTTYAFTAQVTDNDKQYRAVFTNTAGSATTNTALLTVNTGPVVTFQPGNQTVNAGQSASFSAAASGHPAPTVQWQVSIDGGITWTDIPGATATTYTFTPQSPDSGKQYRAVFTNSAGSAASNAALLTVNTAPIVTLQPSNQTVIAWQSASFTAAAEGSPPPTVQWQVSTDGGTTFTGISGATSATYTFTAQGTDNGHEYRAMFVNVAGTATTTVAILSVNKADATVALSNLTQTFDGTPKSATATTDPPGLVVNFTYDGSAIPPTAVGSYAVVATITDPNYAGTASGTLVIRPVPTTVYVDGSYTSASAGGHIFGFDAFSAIQEGLDAVAAGGTVYVATGTYPERLVIDKPLTLSGAGADSSIIDATSFLSPGNVIDISALTGNTKIEGFDIQTGDHSNGIHFAGGTDASGKVEILNNRIVSTNFPDVQYGVIGGYGNVRQLIISGNVVSNTHSGSILVELQRGATEISGNTFNGASPSIWFRTYDGRNVTIPQKVSDNTFDMSAANAGINAGAVGVDSAYGGAGSSTRVGRYTNFEISGNTITGLGDASFKGINVMEESADGLSGGFDSLKIFDNTISGTNGIGIQFSGHIMDADVHDNVLTGLHQAIKGTTSTTYYPANNNIYHNQITGASDKLVHWEGSGAFSVEQNWWGSSAGPNPALMSANVDYVPWCADVGCTRFAGKVTISGNAGVAAATLSYHDGMDKAVTADSSGNYSFTVAYGWSGAVAPSKLGYFFTPPNRVYPALDADQLLQNYATYTDINVYIAGALQGSYNPASGSSTTGSYPAQQNGPVRVVSTTGTPILPSERGFFGPYNTFNELVGYASNQLTNHYWFPWYDNKDMITWVLVGNPSSTDTAHVTIKMAGSVVGIFTIPPLGNVTPTFGTIQNGPVEVTSDVNVFASERTLLGYPSGAQSFNEVMGYPHNQLTNHYWFPWYDDKDMITWVLVGNPSSTDTAHVTIKIAGSVVGTYTIQPFGRIIPIYPPWQGGPVEVSSDINVFTSERSLFGSPSGYTFNEVMGYPDNQLTNDYFFPWYDNKDMITWVLVGNPSSTDTAHVTIKIAGFTKPEWTMDIPPSGRWTPTFSVPPSGPVEVTSDIRVFTSERVLQGYPATGTSFNEYMGIASNKLTNDYWFTWYDNKDMRTSIVISKP